MKDFIKNVDSGMYFEYDDGQIGGDGVEVQIDESAFGKRKYGRGHPVETKWVFGGVEIVPDEFGRRKGGKFFAVVVPDRTKESLHSVMRKFIRPNSVIVSDGFSTYKNIESDNHKRHYVDPETNAHTNTVEGKWNKLKRSIPRQGFRSDDVLQNYLGEQMWRKTNEGHIWEACLVALKNYINIID